MEQLLFFGRIVIAGVLSLMALVYDLKTYKISNKIAVAGVFFAVMFMAGDIFMGQDISRYLYIGILIFAGLFVVYGFGGIGAGDVKLLSVIGLLLGRPAVLITVISFFAAAVLGVLLVLLHKSEKRCVCVGGVYAGLHVMHYSAAIVLSECIVLGMYIVKF